MIFYSSYEDMHKRTADLHYDGKCSTGKRIIIDAAELSPDKFEVMAMWPGGYELETVKAYSLDDAKSAYTDLVCRFTASYPIHPKLRTPLTGKYLKLRDDIRKALAATEHLEATEDGGTCNFDSPVLDLPKWNRSLVKQAAEEAGSSARVWKWGKKTVGFIISPRSSGQGNRRTRRAEAMRDEFKKMGYEASMYYQMD